MRIFAVVLAVSLAMPAMAAQEPYSRWIRVTSNQDQTLRKVELCNSEQTKCEKLGKKEWHSVLDLGNKRRAIKKIRNQTMARKYAFAMLSIVAGPIYLGPTMMFGGSEYKSYVVALDYMSEIEIAAETAELGQALVLVESPRAVEVIRAALDAK